MSTDTHTLPTLATLRGQQPALAVFRAALGAVDGESRVAGAYLLYGPGGVGRRLGAMGFATALLCADPRDSSEPCGECGACGWNAAGTHPDLLFVSAESGPTFRDDASAARGAASAFTRAHHAAAKRGPRRGIQVRALRRLLELLSLTAVGGARKVVVLDSLDEVEEEGVATLLKSLEEPPPDTTFLLLAGGLDNVPDTIVSRCQRARFQPLPPAVVRELVLSHTSVLSNTSGDTPLAADEVDLLVRLSQGSAGRALRAMEIGLLDAAPAAIASLLDADGALGVDDAIAWVRAGGRDLATQRERARELLSVTLLAVRDRAHEARSARPVDAFLPAIAGALESVRANVSPEATLRGLWVRVGRARRLTS